MSSYKPKKSKGESSKSKKRKKEEETNFQTELAEENDESGDGVGKITSLKTTYLVYLATFSLIKK